VASEHLKARKKCLQYGYLLFKLNPEAFVWRHYCILAFRVRCNQSTRCWESTVPGAGAVKVPGSGKVQYLGQVQSKYQVVGKYSTWGR